jgi:hypothetical protein
MTNEITLSDMEHAEDTGAALDPDEEEYDEDELDEDDMDEQDEDRIARTVDESLNAD